MSSRLGIAICIIVENDTVPFDRRVWLEARALAEAGFRVSVVCPTGGKYKSARDSISGIEIYRYPAFNATGQLGHIAEYIWALLAQTILTLQVYARTRFKVIQACNPPDTIFLIAALFKILGVRFVFDHHDLAPELYAMRFGEKGLLYQMVRLAERLSFRTADLSIATNETFREIAIERGRMRRDRLVVVQSCANLDVPEPATTDCSAHLRAGYKHVVAYVGKMEPQDGLDLLSESIRFMVEVQQRRDTLFLLIGDGSELGRLRGEAAKWDLAGQVRFTGRIGHDEVERYLSVADVCVAPDPVNAFNHSCSMVKVFEYMAFAKPIVLYDLVEGRRSAADGALYAKPNDTRDFAEKIIELLDSDTLRMERGANGRRRVEEGLNWQAQSRKLVRAYQSLLGLDEDGTGRHPSDALWDGKHSSEARYSHSR